jgi:hypothetical protein
MSATTQNNSLNKIAALLLAVLVAVIGVISFFSAARSAAITDSAEGLHDPGSESIPIVTATLTVDPLTSTLTVGEAITVDVVLSDVTGLYGIQLDLSFDPAVVNVVGETITPGDCPQPDFVVANSAENVTGTISYAATQLFPTAPCDGGIVAKIAFQAVAEGQSDIHFSDWLLSNSDGEPLPAEAQDGSISVLIPKAVPSLVTTPDPLSGTVGDTLNDSAALSGGDSPTGDITFRLYSPSDATCAGVPAYQQVVTVTGNGVYSTSPGFETDASGTWRWTADYSGDESNEPANSGCDEELVTIEETVEGTMVFLPIVVR